MLLVTYAHGVQRRRKFGCATFLGETHVWVDASVVVTPAADGVSPIQRVPERVRSPPG
jgi:hypothetical protein